LPKWQLELSELQCRKFKDSLGMLLLLWYLRYALFKTSFAALWCWVLGGVALLGYRWSVGRRVVGNWLCCQERVATSHRCSLSCQFPYLNSISELTSGASVMSGRILEAAREDGFVSIFTLDLSIESWWFCHWKVVAVDGDLSQNLGPWGGGV